MSKKVLMIAFHFPPDSSIGTQRTLKTAEYLSDFGWDPLILTVKPNAYDAIERTQIVPQSLGANVYRTGALDVQKHLSIKGKHFEWMKIIDRWTTWIPGAIFKGRKIIKIEKPDLIWSTSPIPSAHIIACFLSNSYQIPWVADYRDPFVHHYLPTKKTRKVVLNMIDKMVMKYSTAVTFATSKAMDLYQDAYEDLASEKLYTVENGFDEQNWQKLTNYKPTADNPISDKKFTLFYSGILYSIGRNPIPLFEAIKNLKSKNIIDSSNFQLILQGPEITDHYKELLNEMDIADVTSFTPNVSYLDSLYFINKANALVLIQDEVFDLQVPGKLYEYMRTGSPILAITSKNSATSDASKNYPLAVTAKTSTEISEILSQWLNKLPGKLNHKRLHSHSRKAKTKEFAKIFNRIISVH